MFLSGHVIMMLLSSALPGLLLPDGLKRHPAKWAVTSLTVVLFDLTRREAMSVSFVALDPGHVPRVQFQVTTVYP